MRAMLVEHAHVAVGVAEHHQILAQDLRVARGTIGLGDLFGEAHRDPVSPHELSHGGIALDPAEQVVFLAGQHLLTPAFTV